MPFQKPTQLPNGQTCTAEKCVVSTAAIDGGCSPALAAKYFFDGTTGNANVDAACNYNDPGMFSPDGAIAQNGNLFCSHNVGLFCDKSLGSKKYWPISYAEDANGVGKATFRNDCTSDKCEPANTREETFFTNVQHNSKWGLSR